MANMDDLSDSLEVHGDPGAYKVSKEYIKQLKTLPLGYQVCIDLLTNGTNYDDSIKCMCLNVIHDHLKRRYHLATDADRLNMHHFLVRYVEVKEIQRRIDSPPTRLIASRIYTIVFIHDYKDHWRDFFSIVYDSVRFGYHTVDHTVRVLHNITAWLSEKAFGSEEDIESKFSIKQAVELSEGSRIVEFLCIAMRTYEQLRDTSLQCFYEMMKWMDVDLFLDVPVLEVICSELREDGEWECAGDCFVQLFKVEGSPQETLDTVRKVCGVIERNLQAATGSVDKRFLAKIGAVHNEIGVCLMTGYFDAYEDVDLKNLSALLSEIESRFIHIYSYLSNPDYEISASIIPSAIKYARLIGLSTPLSTIHREHLLILFDTCLKRLKINLFYDNTKIMFIDNFREYRSKMTEVLKSLCVVDETILLIHLAKELPKVKTWQQKQLPFPDLELPLYLTQVLCEVVALWPGVRLFDDFQGTCEVGVHDIYQAVAMSRAHQHRHPTVITQYFSALVHGTQYFASDRYCLEAVIAAFLSHIGPAQKDQHLRVTCIELFYRFICRLQSDVIIFEAEILKKITAIVLEENLKRESALVLYETASGVIKVGNFYNYQKKINHLELMYPVLNEFRTAISEWHLIAEENRDILAEKLCFTLAVITRTTLVYKNHLESEETGCDENYIKALKIVQHCLSVVNTRPDIHLAMVVLLDRLIVVLDEKLVPYFPTLVIGLFSTTNSVCIDKAVTLLVRMIDKYKGSIAPLLQEEFQRIGHALYLCYEEAMLGSLTPEDNRSWLYFLERLYTSCVEALIRNHIYDEVFVQSDKLPLLNVMFMMVAGCLPSLRVTAMMVDRFEKCLQSGQDELDVDLLTLAEEVKKLFTRRMMEDVF